MLNLLPFVVLLANRAHVGASPVEAAFEAAHPTITQRAELFVREVPESFIGYYTTSDSKGNTFLTSWEKPGSVATFRDSTLVDWCASDSDYLSKTCPTAYWTSCDGVTLLSQGGSTSCTGTCDYDIIYTGSTVDTTSSRRWYHCMTRSYLMLYREKPDGTLLEDMSMTSSSSTDISSSESSTDSSPTPTTASPASTGTTLASQTSDPTKSPTPTAEPAKEKGASKAWIAGVVLGIVGLLAVAGMGFFLWRRRNSHAYGPAPSGPPQAHVQPQFASQHPAYYPQAQPYGNGTSPYVHPVSPNMVAYDAAPKPQEGTAYGGYGVQQYGPPPGVGTVQMPQLSQQVQPQITENMHELPQLAPSSGR